MEGHAELLSIGKEEQHLSAWYWILLIIVVDMIVFLGMHWRRRRQKRLKASNRIEILTSFGDEGERVKLPGIMPFTCLADCRFLTVMVRKSRNVFLHFCVSCLFC